MLVVIFYCSFAKWGKLDKVLYKDLSSIFLITACEPIILNKK